MVAWVSSKDAKKYSRATKMRWLKRNFTMSTLSRMGIEEKQKEK